MHDKLPITVLIAAKNEEVNLEKCLRSLRPARRVVLLDSRSSDNTAGIAERYGVEVVQFEYLGGYPKKKDNGRLTPSSLTPNGYYC